MRLRRSAAARLLIALLPATAAAACHVGEAGTGPPGVGGDAVERAVAAAGAIEGLESLLVWKDGRFLVEEYFTGDADERRHIRSGTKSVTSLLVGIAVDRGLIESLDQPIGELLPEVQERYGPEKARIALRHLLTMRAGLEWDESDVSEFNAWVMSPDPLGHFLSREIVHPPGVAFSYASGASQVLGEVVRRLSGRSLADFARENLFAPLGMKSPRWERLRDGSFNAAAGLELTTRDWLRLGRLVLDGGVAEGRRIVSRAWIEDSTRPWVEAAIPEADYGLHWWVPRVGPSPVVAVVASGFAGQVLLIVPETRAVAAVTCRWQRMPRGGAGRQVTAVMRFLMLYEGRALLFAQPADG